MQTDTSRIEPPIRPNENEPDERIIIHGGKPLEGSVTIGGAKNAVLKIMAAALLSREVSVLRNVPMLTDVYMMSKIIENLGAKVKFANNEPAQPFSHTVELTVPSDGQARGFFRVRTP